MKKLWIAAAALLCWLPAVDAQASQPIKAADPCELAGNVALNAIAGFLPERPIFDEQPFRGTRITPPMRPTYRPRDIPADLVTRWEAGSETSLLQACPMVRLPATVRMATAEDRTRVSGLQHNLNLLQISAPVVSKSGEDLLIEVRSRCAGLCGSGEILHFRRTVQGWVRMAPAARYIS
jgi:hypothetical protein